MSEISKLQIEILENLYIIDVSKNSDKRIQPEFFTLEEKDEIMKTRELVYNIDQLVKLQFITTSDKYYVESDNMSFEYMNNALEILDDRVNISPLGIQYIEQLKKSNLQKFNEGIRNLFENSFLNHPYKVLATHLTSFALGLLIMWIILRIL